MLSDRGAPAYFQPGYRSRSISGFVPVSSVPQCLRGGFGFHLPTSASPADAFSAPRASLPSPHHAPASPRQRSSCAASSLLPTSRTSTAPPPPPSPPIPPKTTPPRPSPFTADIA